MQVKGAEEIGLTLILFFYINTINEAWLFLLDTFLIQQHLNKLTISIDLSRLSVFFLSDDLKPIGLDVMLMSLLR